MTAGAYGREGEVLDSGAGFLNPAMGRFGSERGAFAPKCRAFGLKSGGFGLSNGVSILVDEGFYLRTEIQSQYGDY